MKRWALVTAGAQGLGLAITQHLAGRGWSVIVHHRSSEPPQAAAAAVAADLSNAAGREQLMREVAQTTGADGLHLLVNNLGVYPLEHLLETPIEVFEKTFALTCTAVFHLTQLGLPLLRAARPAARIVNIGDSTCDRVSAHDDATPYYIAKLGVHVLTRTYAQQLGPAGITVNMVSPGFLENSVGQPDTAIALGRKGRFEDIVGAIDYLLSDAGAYVTGANLGVTGGWNL